MSRVFSPCDREAVGVCMCPAITPRRPLECACAVTPTRHCCGRAKHFLAFMVRSGTRAVAANVADAHLVHGLLTKQTHEAKYGTILLTTPTVRAIEAYHCHIIKLIIDRGSRFC